MSRKNLSLELMKLKRNLQNCSNKYQGVKNFTLVARMQNSSPILRATDESSMFRRFALPAMNKTPQNVSET